MILIYMRGSKWKRGREDHENEFTVSYVYYVGCDNCDRLN